MRTHRVICITVLLITNSLKADFWSDVGKGFEQIGEKTYDNVIKPTGDLAEDAWQHIKDCATMIGLGSEWASKQAAVNSANGALELARQSSHGIAFIVEGLGQLGGRAINLEEISFEVNGKDLAKTTLVTCHIKGVFFGKSVSTNIPVNLKDIGKSIKDGFNTIIKNLH